jgi:hypothetical protein
MKNQAVIWASNGVLRAFESEKPLAKRIMHQGKLFELHEFPSVSGMAPMNSMMVYIESKTVLDLVETR